MTPQGKAGEPGEVDRKPPYVVMECVGCTSQRKVGPGEPMPFCAKDGMPMIAVKAVAR